MLLLRIFLIILAINIQLITECKAVNTNILSNEYLVIDKAIKKLESSFGLKSNKIAIIVSISKQKLYLVRNGEILKSFPISTSKYGIGNRAHSFKTPLGTHRIAKKIGEGTPIGTIFIGGINTHKIATIYTDETDLEEDLVTTRIMWLEGLEEGINKGKGIDSYKRRIYIHGTPEEGLIGKPASNGCIRMKNEDVIELFNIVKEGTLVEIQE